MTTPTSSEAAGPVDPADPPLEGARARQVAAAVRTWTGQLVDLGGRNTLLYYKDLRQGTLDLGAAGAEPTAVDDLLSSRTVRLSWLFSDEKDLAAAAKRARTVRAKAVENFEERGIQTLFLAYGMATWTNTRGTATPAAPVFLRAAHLVPKGGAGEDFDLSLTDDFEVNPTLLHLLSSEYQIDVAGEGLLDLVENDDAGDTSRDHEAFSQLAKAADAVPGFTVLPRVVLGNFSYAKLPMVKDLEAAGETLLDNELIAAIAGDETARTAVRARHPDVALDQPDRTPPADEFLVLDADASQSFVINAVVGGGDLVVAGPPGTGKSQTIANLIATLAARGQRVLFVAEKRAAIDAVLDRLNRVGLADLVLDLHDGAGSRRKLAQDLSKTLASAATVRLPTLEESQKRLVGRRDALRQRVVALHEPRSPWGVSVFDVQSRLLGIAPTVHSAQRLRGADLERFDSAAFVACQEELRDFVGLGGLSLSSSSSPWANALAAGAAMTSPDQAQAVLASAVTLANHTLPSTSAALERVLNECALTHPLNIESWASILALLDDVANTLAILDMAIFDEDLDALLADLAPAQGGAFGRFGARVGNGQYRRARKKVLALCCGPKLSSADLYAAVATAASQQHVWAELATDGGRPRLPGDLAGTEGALGQLNLELRAVGAWVGAGGWEQLSEDELARRLSELLDDQTTLYKLPELHRLRASLLARNIGPLLVEIEGRRMTTDQALGCLEQVWLASVLETVSLSDSRIGAFDGEAHRRTVAEFQDADISHIATAPTRVRRAVAERATRVRDEYPRESDVIERQARLKRKHLPVRQLFQAAPHVLGALKPCWAMSPLVVSQLLPADRCFDVVVFDEASQITPADAVGALMRAERAVVAGDPKQLPPTSFFAVSGGGEDDEDDEAVASALTTGMESVLDVMGALLPAPKGTRTLGWHYRSKDERLIAFSNAQLSLYDFSLTTFPGVAGDDCLAHVLVPYASGRVGQEDSVSDEVERVVELIFDHVESRPQESLGVITMGIKHANRVSESLRRCRAERPELDQWFDQGPEGHGGKEAFFVKNLERVQGDERDSIILSVGYGKSADGRLLYRFGPINNEGGERRLNVAITRARSHMTVVSSFASADMDPGKLRSEGAKMLGHYLAYTESGGTNLGDIALDKPVLNSFERDVRDQLTAAGIPLVAQYGCSGYWIDFAAQHPTMPGRMVLAIEADGASYHSSNTARDRDRLRQEHLERLGWRFHRIWSSDWFHRREDEVVRAKSAYDEAVRIAATRPAMAGLELDMREPLPPSEKVHRRGPKPRLDRCATIGQYSEVDLVSLVRWIESDTLLRTEEELLEATMAELGLARKGAKIVATLTEAIREARRPVRPPTLPPRQPPAQPARRPAAAGRPPRRRRPWSR